MVRAYIGTADLDGLRRLDPAPDDHLHAATIEFTSEPIVSRFWAAAEDETIDEVRFLLRHGHRRHALDILAATAVDLVAVNS